MDYARVYREVDVALDRAKHVGVPVVLLTDHLALELADRIDVALQAVRGKSAALGSDVTSLVVLEALLLGIATCDRPLSLAAGEELNELRAQLVGHRIDVDPGPAQRT
jgi:DNA-binding MurR/RpiR family transcriptional regulator